MMERGELHGLIAVFDNPDALLAAAKKTYASGYRKIDAYTPIPVHHLGEAIGFKPKVLPWIVLFGGLFGAGLGLFMQYYIHVVDYPLNIGGRPFFSWPSFIPVTFECCILFAGFAAVFGMLGLNGFPQPYNPIFNAPDFELASRSHFFLCIEAEDPQFDQGRTMEFLNSLGPEKVSEVAK